MCHRCCEHPTPDSSWFCSCCCRRLPQRYLVVLLCFLSMLICFAQRAALNISIMEISVAVDLVSNNTTTAAPKSCPSSELTIIPRIGGGRVHWPEYVQHQVLGSFYLGYSISPVLMGYLSDRYGARRVLIYAVTVASGAALLIPAAIHEHWGYVIALRLIAGLAQGCLFPCCASFLSHWIPPTERTLLAAVTYSGSAVGVVTGIFITGLVLQYLRYWPASFYLWGALGVIWASVAAPFLYSSPAYSPHISAQEKLLLERVLPKAIEGVTKVTPWLRMLRDRAVYACILACVGHDCIGFLCFTSMPKYFNNVLNLKIQDNSLLMSLPLITNIFLTISTGFLADYLIEKKHVGVALVRKSFATSAAVIPAVLLVTIGYVRCRQFHAEILMVFAMITQATYFSGMHVNILDVTRNFAGILMAITNGSGSLVGYFVPVLIGVLAPNNLIEEWQRVFWMVFVVAVATTIAMWYLGSGKRSAWDYMDDEEVEA